SKILVCESRIEFALIQAKLPAYQYILAIGPKMGRNRKTVPPTNPHSEALKTTFNPGMAAFISLAITLVTNEPSAQTSIMASGALSLNAALFLSTTTSKSPENNRISSPVIRRHAADPTNAMAPRRPPYPLNNRFGSLCSKHIIRTYEDPVTMAMHK